MLADIALGNYTLSVSRIDPKTTKVTHRVKLPDKTGRPLPEKAFRIADLGGWKAVNASVFGPKGVWTSLFLGK